MNAAQRPESVAAGISLIEIALGPEIAEETFNIIMGMDTFEAACRRTDAKVKLDEHNERLRALLCDVSFVSAWTLIQKRRAASQATVEALWQSFKESGIESLTDPANQDRLRRCDAAAIGALEEPHNIARLARCDAAARAEINRRIAALHSEETATCEIM